MTSNWLRFNETHGSEKRLTVFSYVPLMCRPVFFSTLFPDHCPLITRHFFP